MAKGDRYSEIGTEAAFGFFINALGGGGDAGQTFPRSDAEDFSRGCQFIPDDVTLARRRGEVVVLNTDCINRCCWYWQMPDGSRIYHWHEQDYRAIARANKRASGSRKQRGNAGQCPQCRNTNTNGDTVCKP